MIPIKASTVRGGMTKAITAIWGSLGPANPPNPSDNADIRRNIFVINEPTIDPREATVSRVRKRGSRNRGPLPVKSSKASLGSMSIVDTLSKKPRKDL